MNKLEARYSELLSARKHAGEIVAWSYEAIKFKLADNTFYTPDFMVTFDDHIEIHETKGFRREDAMIKIKVCAAQFWQFRFVLVEFNKGWKFTEY